MPITTFQCQAHDRRRIAWLRGITAACRRAALRLGGLLLVACSVSAQPEAAVTLDALRADPDLTPDRLLKRFAPFKYALARETRSPEVFLATQAGDCDDFATLAADLLRAKGYSTKVVVVYMARETHVVCYVAETRGYLDYNCRTRASPLIRCGSDLAAIANQVARSFGTQWHAASEVAFKDGARQFVATAFR